MFTTKYKSTRNICRPNICICKKYIYQRCIKYTSRQTDKDTKVGVQPTRRKVQQATDLAVER